MTSSWQYPWRHWCSVKDESSMFLWGLSPQFSSGEHHSCSCGTLGTLTYWWSCSHKIIIRSSCCLVGNLFSHEADVEQARSWDKTGNRGCCGHGLQAERCSAVAPIWRSGISVYNPPQPWQSTHLNSPSIISLAGKWLQAFNNKLDCRLICNGWLHLAELEWY